MNTNGKLVTQVCSNEFDKNISKRYIAIQKLEAIAKEKRVRKNSLAYKSALEAINNPGTEVICGTHTGTGRFAGSKSWKFETSELLRKVGVEFRAFNVAPKGGRKGDRVQVTSI